MNSVRKPDGTLLPSYRRIRAYAFDPSLSLKIDTAAINDIVYKIPWEELSPGPKGEYIEIINYDPTIKKFYKSLNLDESYVLAQDGYDPSESNPLFHQQMVYAVIMTTIDNFEKALGRKILWAPHRLEGSSEYEEYVQRLRVYPYALREANAFYSPLKKALLFGYFSSSPANDTLHMPDSIVFTCLSSDIIAHEVTHAILDGIYGLYNIPTNPDVGAFHEAFADIVALFQHFTFPEVLKHQIAKTRGDLASQNLLGQLAQEFGAAIGNYGSLRDAIGGIDVQTQKWKLKEPSPEEYQTVMEPHDRGSILVAAIFDAFINIYKNRIADLLRIASNGTGILPQGELHPDLVNRLAKEAAKTAQHVLNMCIRALDYCPPTDITFGDYLRAIITADVDVVSDDSRDYRLAFIDAFRKRGIYPEGIRTLSVESLMHPMINLRYNTKNDAIDTASQTLNASIKTDQVLKVIIKFLQEYANEIKYTKSREDIYHTTKEYIIDTKTDQYTDKGLHSKIKSEFSDSHEFEKITGIAFGSNAGQIGIKIASNQIPSFQIQNLRLISRVGPENNQINYVLFSIIQRAGVVIKDNEIIEYFVPSQNLQEPMDKDSEVRLEFRGGCTLIFDLDTSTLKYAISKPIINIEGDITQPRINRERVLRQFKFQMNCQEMGFNKYTKYFSAGIQNWVEPFNIMHQR